MASHINRRSFVKGTLLSSAGAALALNAHAQTPAKPAGPPPNSLDSLPRGKIGKLEVIKTETFPVEKVDVFMKTLV